MTTDEADRMHSGVISSFAAAMHAIDGARLEQRAGYAAAVCPAIPLPGFNGLWIGRDVPRDELLRAVGEVEGAGVRCWLLVRTGTTHPFDEAAAALGFHFEEAVPAMALRRQELLPASPADVEIRHVGAIDLATTIEVSAAGFGGPLPIFEAMYAGMAATPGFGIYAALVEGAVVSTACSWLGDGAVGIYNVATPPEHRRRGYARAVTERAIRDGFEDGADLAWLQASELGASVYRSMGFRDIETYRIYARPEPRAG